jgi:amino acid permease
MQTMDRVVIKETKYMAAWVLILSAVMQAVFLVIGRWDYTVLLGNVLSAAAVVGNFFGMAVGIQRALGKEEKDAKQAIRASNALRLFGMFAVLALGVLLPCFSTWTTVIPIFFPRLIVALRPLWDKKMGEEEHADES